MDEHKIYDDFLKSLRTAFTNASIYSKDHPLFIKSVEDLKTKAGSALLLLNPLFIEINIDSLSFGDEQLEGQRLYSEVANFFHIRKVKSIQFKEGIINEELVNFLTQTNASAKDILAKGGLSTILKKNSVSNIIIEDLDYSQLLEGEGVHLKETWLSLMKEGLSSSDPKKIDELVNNFNHVVDRIGAKDLLENAEARSIISNFLKQLKESDTDKFLKNTKGLAKSILKSKHLSDDSSARELGTFLKDIKADDFSALLLEQLAGGEGIDPLSFNLFSQLFGRQKHKEVVHSLADKLQSQEKLKNNAQVMAGIKELMSLPINSYVSQIYRQNLSSIFKDTLADAGICFDRSQLKNNFRFILLDLFIWEVNQKELQLLLDKILIEINETIGNSNLDYTKEVIKALGRKRNKHSLSGKILQDAGKRISSILENAFFTEGVSLDFEYCINILRVSSLGVEFYINKVFNEDKINSYILRLFFKFFPDDLTLFCENLNRKISDIRLVKKIIENIKEIEPKFGLEILKYVFYPSNDFIKTEVLKVIKELPICDEGFLVAILKKQDFAQSKLALSALAKNPRMARKTAKRLLDIPNPLGLKIRILKENLKLIREVPFKESKEYLLKLSKYRFFWNRGIRKIASKLLEKDVV